MTAQSSISNRFLKVFACLVLVFIVVSVAAWLVGIRYNHTDSYELGFWRIVSDYQANQKGSTVLFCPQSEGWFSEAKERDYIGAGYCDSGLEPLLKKVIADAGDLVVINERGISVNGEFIQNSQPSFADGLGREMKINKADQVLAGDQVVLFSDYNNQSFDSRYFGIVDGSTIEGVVAPVWTWERKSHE